MSKAFIFGVGGNGEGSSDIPLKTVLDTTKSTSYLFYQWPGEDINGYIEHDDTSNVTNMNDMFNGCKNLTTVPLFDTSKVTNMSNMFRECYALTTVPLFDTSSVTNMNQMFYICKTLTEVPLFDTSNVKTMNQMFHYCYKLTTVPPFDTSNVTSMKEMFSECYALTTVPLFNTSKVTNMDYIFMNCTNLTTVPLFDISNITSMGLMFSGCTNLTTVPLFDTSKVTNMQYTFQNCRNLTTIPLFDTSKVTRIYRMLWGCDKLTTIPALDIRNVKILSSGDMFNSSRNVTECWLKNINVTLNVSDSNKLTIPSLLSLLNETVYTTSSKTLTLGSANLEKFTGDYEYVKPTGVYLDLDDNEVTELTDGTTKIPVTWCSSTDEGAMKVADYMSSKGWGLA